jgi:ATP-dependent RNA helicase DDX51/DBP6
VSSDALARGIDVPIVDCVVSYDVPQQAKLYVHRVGRTGRAGRKGDAVTVLSPQQLPSFQHMLRGAGKESGLNAMKSPDSEMQALEGVYKEALNSIKQTIEVN